MSRLTVFNTPFVVGFDHVERMVERIAKAGNESYPPFNIEHFGGGRLRISLAVAGFRKEELFATLEDTVLTVRGKQPDAADGARTYLHRGIATRQFQKRFVVERGIEVIAATLANGLLNIDLQQPDPSPKAKEIVITDGARSGAEIEVETSA